MPHVFPSNAKLQAAYETFLGLPPGPPVDVSVPIYEGHGTRVGVW